MIASSRTATALETRLIFAAFVVLLALSALDAYDVGRVPLQWVMELGTIATALYVASRYRLRRPMGAVALAAFVGWAVLVTVVGSTFGHFSRLMPIAATTPYVLFVGLRLTTLVFYVACLYLVGWLADQMWGERVMKAAVVAGVLIAAIAIYVYLAQVYGWPEPPRSRLGTSGAAQPVRFTYDFHRATGTFREPSLLAAWLMLPLFLSFALRGVAGYLAAALIAGTILLTGSLSGIVAILVGAAVVLVAVVALVWGRLRSILVKGAAGLVVIILALGIFYGLAVSNNSHGVNLFATLSDRVLAIFRGGLLQSDRFLVYSYVAHSPPPFLGTGLGNSNLLLTHYLNTSVIASFISLYLNTLYSTGMVGLLLLAAYLLTPVWTIARAPATLRSLKVVMLVGPYVSWLVVFTAAMEELTLMFGIVTALLACEISAVGSERGEDRPAPLLKLLNEAISRVTTTQGKPTDDLPAVIPTVTQVAPAIED